MAGVSCVLLHFGLHMSNTIVSVVIYVLTISWTVFMALLVVIGEEW